MKPTSDVIACVADHGIFYPIAQRLARDFKKVYYWTPTEKAFPTVKDIIGDGFEDVERVESIWEVHDEVDVFVFPDIGWRDLQRHLIEDGHPVWGPRDGDLLEISRGKFLEALMQTDLPVPKYVRVEGMTALKAHLVDKTDKWIKISRFRGDWETLHFRDWEQDETTLDIAAVKFGPWKEQIPFYVFDPIETTIEDGYDGYCIDGKWPSLCIHGMECKDKAYLGAFQEYSDLPEQVRKVTDTFGPILGKYGYRGFFSAEVRITKDNESYFIDPTCFSEDTEVLTVSGWKEFKDVTLRDKICTLNPETHEIQYHFPARLVCYGYDGEMILITNRRKDLELLVTPDHAVWGVSKHGNSLQEFRATDIPYSLSIPRSGKWTGIELSTYRIPEYTKTWHSGKGKGIDKTHHKDEKQVSMDDWLKFLAIYLSEGSHRDWQVSISQTKHQSEMAKILEALPFKWTRGKRGFVCSDVQLCNALPDGDRYSKAIPSYVKELCPRQINLFLDAYCLGDGSIDSGNRVISTPSLQTANDLQELFLKSGSLASVRKRAFVGKSCAISNGKYTCRHDSYLIRERQDFLNFYIEGWKNPRHEQYLKKVHYSGTVYDLTVTNHVIFVRRNGKPCWSGNCRAGSPPSQVQTEMIANYGDIIWQGAQGELVNPEPAAKVGVQALLCASAGRQNWLAVEIPDELKQWVKCGFCSQIDGKLVFPPDPDNTHGDIGWLVAIGDSPKEAIDCLKDYAAALPDGLCAKTEAIVDLIHETEDAEKQGIELTQQPMPEPAEVIEQPHT